MEKEVVSGRKRALLVLFFVCWGGGGGWVVKDVVPHTFLSSNLISWVALYPRSMG